MSKNLMNSRIFLFAYTCFAREVQERGSRLNLVKSLRCILTDHCQEDRD